MFDIQDPRRWAEQTFGQAVLDDKRRTDRLVEVAACWAHQTGASIAQACGGDEARLEASYRWLGNDAIEPEAIAEAGFEQTVKQARSVETLLAIEDSSPLCYSHGVVQEMGDVGGPEKSKVRGCWVHSVLLVDAASERTVGLVEQEYWIREVNERGKSHKRKERAYEEKESFKWQQASERFAERLGSELMPRVVSICDREADIYAYLSYKVKQGERFVVRAQWDRGASKDAEGEAERSHIRTLLEQAPLKGEMEVHVPQRQGRRARDAKLKVRAMSLRLHRPKGLSKDYPERLRVNVVFAYEENAPVGEEPLEWILFTSEPIYSEEEVEQVLRFYRLRWRIEDFHKAWKTGAGVERLRLQKAQSILRAAVVLAFIAVRLLQLRELFAMGQEVPCEEILTRDEWRMLWVAVEKKRPPQKCPGSRWALHALGRLGGWTDTKRTGRVGWQALWRGWEKLQERMEGHRASLFLVERREM